MREKAADDIFQSTLPAWGATRQPSRQNTTNRFQSTLPAWGVTVADAMDGIKVHVFQSTLPAWGATGRKTTETRVMSISIHAPRMGSDIIHIIHFGMSFLISIHAPRMGSDRRNRNEKVQDFKFQSTLPAWGATVIPMDNTFERHISIHAPRMGSDDVPEYCSLAFSNFNPRSPHGERQPPIPCISMAEAFQSTLPAWGAT